MELTRENLIVLRNMKKVELLHLVVHTCMRIAEEKNLIEDQTVISDLFGILCNYFCRYNKVQIINTIFDKYLLTRIIKSDDIYNTKYHKAKNNIN